jgi:hypothetical protein
LHASDELLLGDYVVAHLADLCECFIELDLHLFLLIFKSVNLTILLLVDRLQLLNLPAHLLNLHIIPLTVVFTLKD